MIAILPIGKINVKDIEFLDEFLSKIFNKEVKISKNIELDEKYYNKRRNQYYSSLILKDITSGDVVAGVGLPEKYDRILAIVDVDLYVPQLNFVFGEADIKNGVCIISIYRLRQSFYRLKEDEELFKERIKKEAVHELGHTYYLTHCSNPRCVMYFSNSILDTDRKDYNFCNICKKKLKENS